MTPGKGDYVEMTVRGYVHSADTDTIRLVDSGSVVGSRSFCRSVYDVKVLKKAQLKVGDLVNTEEKAANLPAGAVVISYYDTVAVKRKPNVWEVTGVIDYISDYQVSAGATLMDPTLLRLPREFAF